MARQTDTLKWAPRFERLVSCALSVAFVLLIVAGCGGKPKADAAAAARTFLEQVSRGELTAAYKSAAFGFQSLQNEKVFDATTRELGLLNSKVETITPAEADAKSARLDVVVQMAGGEPRSFVVNMQVENGAWRLYSIREPRNPKTGVSENRFSLVGKTPMFAESMSRPMPAEREINRLTRGSMISFSDAIKNQSFAEFYAYISRAWRSQITEQKLQRAFQEFIDSHVNLSGTAEVEPIYDAPPQMNADGLLLVSGHYPTKGFEVYFAFKFIYELPEWKLFGLDVYLRKAPGSQATPMPVPGEKPATTPAVVPEMTPTSAPGGK